MEEKLKQLEATVAALEKGDMPLEEAVKLYTAGVELAALCKKDIDGARLKIAVQE